MEAESRAFGRRASREPALSGDLKWGRGSRLRWGRPERAKAGDLTRAERKREWGASDTRFCGEGTDLGELCFPADLGTGLALILGVQRCFRGISWGRSVHGSAFMFGLLALCWASPSPSWAQSEVRTSVAPSTGLGLSLSERWSAAAQFQMRLGGEASPGYAIMSVAQRQASPRFATQIGYDALFGSFAMDGVTRGEQRIHLGVIWSTAQGSSRRLFAWSRTRLDLRALRRDPQWQRSLRPRQELRVGWRIAPFLTLALGSEALVDPLQKGRAMLQTRHRLMAFGQWSPRRSGSGLGGATGARRAPKWSLRWLIADTWALHPLARSPVISGVSAALGPKLGPEVSPGESRERKKVIWHQLSFALSASF